MGINSMLAAGGMLGLAVVISAVSGIGGATKNLQRSATDSAVKLSATQSASDLKAEKIDHAKQLANLVRDPSTVIFTTRQISAASTKGNLQTMRSVIKPGSRITVGGDIGKTISSGSYVTDNVGTIGIVNEKGVVENPYNPLASHLPTMTPDQIRAFRNFQPNDLYATPPEALETPNPETLVNQNPVGQ
jgi:hypothetical protein